MNTTKLIKVDGISICSTHHAGKPMLRMKDAMSVLRVFQFTVDQIKQQLIENAHWMNLENPFTKDYELFVTVAGLGVIAARYGFSEKAREIAFQMAEAWE